MKLKFNLLDFHNLRIFLGYLLVLRKCHLSEILLGLLFLILIELIED